MAPSSKPLAPTLRMSSDPNAEPILDNPKRPRMAGEKPVRRRIGGQWLVMAEEPAQEASSGPGLMSPVPQATRPIDARPGGPQQALPPTAQEGSSQPQSVRLRVRVTNGVATVIDVRVVPGVAPLPERLLYGLAYEIRNGSRCVAVGSLPDVGMRRSYPDPKGRAGMRGHHLAELQSIEVNLRLPRQEFLSSSLAKLRVQLYRMKSQPPAQALTRAPLIEQFPDLLRPAAELRGIRLEGLGPTLRASIEAALASAPGPGRG
jgi:hypothetical protein